MEEKFIDEEKGRICTRKLIKWGSSNTLIISLPRRWIQQNNLNPDQIVKIHTNQDGTITIIPQELNISENSESFIKIKDPDDLEDLELRILTKYLDGWDIIKISSNNPFSSNMTEKLEDVIEPMLGLEILGINNYEIVLKNVMNIDSTHVLNLVKMISNYAIELGALVLNYFQNPISPPTNLGKTQWKNIRKYHFRITREQRRALLHPATLIKMELTLQDVMDFYQYDSNIYEIGKCFKNILDYMLKLGVPEDIFGIKSFLISILDVVKDSIDSFLTIDTKKSINTIKKINIKKPLKREIENKVDEVVDLDQKIKYIVFQILLDLSEKILDYSENACLAALRRAI